MGIARAMPSPICAQRTIIIHRIRHRDVNQVRQLWGWGKSRRSWWQSDSDDTEEHWRRHQALMMHRYTRAMKRRAIWDRDTTSSSSSPWRVVSKWNRDMSSTESKKAKVEGEEEKAKEYIKLKQEMHQNFESFKRAVDKAIARDPYGTLFGRRLRSPESTNNSSWTSWSRIFDPKEIKQDSVLDAEQPLARPTQSKSTDASPVRQSPVEADVLSVNHTSSSSKTTTSVRSSRSIVFQDGSSIATEYTYDPISGRKIQKSASSAVSTSEPTSRHTAPSTPNMQMPLDPKPLNTTSNVPAKDFLSTMFGEHGVDIPVKTYKPHKVFGYTGEVKPSKSEATPDSKLTKTSGNSRVVEFNALRWRTLGNNIDSTNFNCEPWNNTDMNPASLQESLLSEQSESKTRTSPEPAEDTPLFSGTTYQARSVSEPEVESQSDWLAQEGFRAKQGMTMSSLKDKVRASAPMTTAEKLEPSLNRPALKSSTTDIPHGKSGSRLQSSVDRILPVSKSNPLKSSVTRFSDLKAEEKSSAVPDVREDIDLLRASDIRAASKAARVTKQEVEEKKQQHRKELEEDYQARDQADLGNVWKHIKNNPTGIVARTMQSMGIVNPAAESKKPTTVTSYDTSSFRPTALTKPSTESDKQLMKLGSELKAVYEQVHGRIDEKSVADTHIAPHLRKMTEPTVKPGVVRDFEMERYTQEFEPKLANLVQEARSVKRALHEISLTAREIVSERAIVDGSSLRSETGELFPYLRLQYEKGGNRVKLTSLMEVDGAVPEVKNVMAVIGTLDNPSDFVRYFAKLDEAGYTIIRGNSDTLIFKGKKPTIDTSQLQNTIAEEEAAAQPDNLNFESRRAESESPQVSAFDTAESEVLAEVTTKSRRKTRSGTRMTRQEPVFSGQQRLKPQTTGLPDPEHFQKQNPPTSAYQSQSQRQRQQEQEQEQEQEQQNYQQQYQQYTEPKLGYFARFRRLVRRVILTGLAFGTGAYGIGVIAEATQGRAQIVGGGSDGPMKRLVLEERNRGVSERQRSGIYSTESSR